MRKLQELAGKLGLPPEVVGKASELLQRSVSCRELRGFMRVERALGAVYLASLLLRYPLRERFVTETLYVPLRTVYGAARRMASCLGLQLPRRDYEGWVESVVSQLNLPPEKAEEVARLAKEIITELRREGELSGGKPRVVASAAVVLALELLGLYNRSRLSLREVCLRTGTTEVAVRNWKYRALEVLMKRRPELFSL